MVMDRNSTESDGNGLKTKGEHNCDAENSFPGSVLVSGSKNRVDFLGNCKSYVKQTKKNTKSSLMGEGQKNSSQWM